MTAGNSSSGIFSLAFADAQHGLATGGDYRKEQDSGDNLVSTSDGGQTWSFLGTASQPASATGPRSRERAANPVFTPARLRSFRSAAAFVPGSKGRGIVAVGPGGTDVSRDGGATWTPLGEDGYHAFSFARGRAIGWAAGEQGRVALYR